MLIRLLIFFFNDTATTEIYTLSLHDSLPISDLARRSRGAPGGCRRSRSAAPSHRGVQPAARARSPRCARSEEHTSELQSQSKIVCRLLLEKKKLQRLSFYSVLNLLVDAQRVP